LSRLKRLEIIGTLVVQEANSICITNLDAPPVRAIAQYYSSLSYGSDRHPIIAKASRGFNTSDGGKRRSNGCLQFS
jgi:hypothetical protein